MTSWNCPNCEHTPASVCDTQLYLPSASTIGGGYETDSSWDLNPDADSDTEVAETEVEVIEESEDAGTPRIPISDCAVVVRRKPKANREDSAIVSGGSQMSFADVGRRFAATIGAAHMPM